MIRTKKAKPTERLTSSEDNARRGLIIKRGLVRVLELYRPLLAAQEGAAGSKSALAAAALARAQQACVDAVDQVLGCDVIFVTQQAAKKSALGRIAVTKGEMEEAMRAYWKTTDWDALLRAKPIYEDKAPPKGLWENAFDASAVAKCVWKTPAVAAARAAA